MDELDRLILDALKRSLKLGVSTLLPELMEGKVATPASCADGLVDAFVRAGAHLFVLIGLEDANRLLRACIASTDLSPGLEELEALTQDAATCLLNPESSGAPMGPEFEHVRADLHAVFRANPQLRMLCALSMYTCPDDENGAKLATRMRAELHAALRELREPKVH